MSGQDVSIPARVEIRKVLVPTVDGDRKTVRVYCEQSGERYALQVRGPMKLQSGKEAAGIVVAHASLTRSEVLELIGQLTAQVNE